MSVSAETYIVISLMFAVFAAVAAVGTSVVLGAGFERLRAGFEVVRNQSGFFADAIYKLDQKTQKLDEDHAKLKGNVTHLGERVDRVEKTATFLADGLNSLEHRILQGSPAQQATPRQPVRMVSTVHTISQKPKSQPQPARQVVEEPRVHQPQQQQAAMMAEAPAYRDLPELSPANSDAHDFVPEIEDRDTGEGFTTLLARYFVGESSGGGKGIVYH